MAVNQVSLFFYPPRWQQRCVPDPTALTDLGTPLQRVYAVPAANADGPLVSATAVKGWLAERGFTPVEWWPDGLFERGQVRSMFGLEKEIEIRVGEEAGEITDLYCRFTLPRRTPPPLSEWTGLMAELCGRFGLRQGSNGVAPCGEAEFRAAVQGDRFYQHFAALYGWEPDAEPAVSPDQTGQLNPAT